MNGKYANVIVDISHEKVDRPFQYLIPLELQGKIEPGMRVTVPFGNGNKNTIAYVLECTDRNDYDPKRLKEIDQICADSTQLEEKLINLAWWMKNKYGCTMSMALKTVLPIKKKVNQKTEKTVCLALEENQAVELAKEFERKKYVARYRLLNELIKEKEIPWEVITMKLQVSGAAIKSMAEKGILEIRTATQQATGEVVKHDDVEYTEEQKQVLNQIRENIRKQDRTPCLIHGVTGSGKTLIYMELVEDVIKNKKQAIVLIPEIALTYQTLKRFYSRFPGRVGVLNSKQSQGERYELFQKAKKREIDVVIGPRSALFTPFDDLGMIVIDEEHETSYKSETMPRYHAREVALELAKRNDAYLIYGSATPSLELYRMAEEKKIYLFKMNERIWGKQLPQVHTIDMREELKEGNRSIFSRKLRELMEERLQKNQQIMLFLNRRGYSGFVSCRSCGLVMKCPHCDVSLSQHKGNKLICHYCGYQQPSVESCPECGSPYISGFKAGTQQVEDQLIRYFPNAKILRMDADTTRSKESYETILSGFSNREADILVGTQMIVKGHDFPDVTLVGILAADLSLFVNDYHSSERTFQLLTQAAGRAGRGNEKGEVVIQTYQPEHFSIVHSTNQDYEGFYEEEIEYRRLMHYPPVGTIAEILIWGEQEKKVAELTERITNFIKKIKETNAEKYQYLIVLGPAPAGIGKINDIFRYHIYLKHEKEEILHEIVDYVEEERQKNHHGKEMIQYDFNPVRTG